METQSSRTDPFVVFGPSKSGTTWVQRMLNAHPDVSCEFQPGILELTGLKKATAPGVTSAQGSPYGGVFKSDDAESMYRAKLDFMRRAGFLQPDYPETVALESESAAVTNELRRIHRTMVRGAIQAYLDATTDRPIRGYKMHVDVDFFLELFPGARIVFVLRDGRDVCVSMRHHRLRQGIYYNGEERWAALRFLNQFHVPRRITKALVRRFDGLRNVLFRDLEAGPLFSPAALDKAARDWSTVVDYILGQCAAYPDNHIVVRYEDFLADPNGTLRKLLAFLRADTSDQVVQEIIERTSMDNLKQNKPDGFFRKGIAGDWRNVFTVDDVRLFKELAGSQLINLGYETDDSWSLEE